MSGYEDPKAQESLRQGLLAWADGTTWLQKENARLRRERDAIELELIQMAERNEKLRGALEECANDLEASVNAEYAGTLDYPSQKRRWERDMEPVVKARNALANEEGK